MDSAFESVLRSIQTDRQSVSQSSAQLLLMLQSLPLFGRLQAG